MERRFTRAVCAPVWIGVNRSIAGYVQDQRMTSVACGSSQGSKQRFGQSKGTEHIGLECEFEILAVSVSERCERDRAKSRRIIDEHVQSPERSEYLDCDPVDIVLFRHISCDPACLWLFTHQTFYSVAVAGNESHPCSAVEQHSNQRQPQARRSPRNCHSHAFPSVLYLSLVHFRSLGFEFSCHGTS